MSDRDMLIGPGRSNYGDTCTDCYTSGIRAGKPHRPSCPRVVDRCVSDEHEACRKQGCECLCHGPLTSREILVLRELIGGRKKRPRG